LNGADRFDKPIGVYWLQALSVSLLGLNEFALRLPSALSAWLACMALALTAHKAWGPRAAVLAAMVFASSLGPWAMARTATADALLGLWLMLTALDLWRYVSTQDRSALRRTALWMALAKAVTQHLHAAQRYSASVRSLAPRPVQVIDRTIRISPLDDLDWKVLTSSGQGAST
jgi:4-amino-4-deoxy-L-arabinose transferase-like glycosyltransferase